MARREPSESGSEPEDSNSNEASSEEEEKDDCGGNYKENEEEEEMPGYERQRRLRIAENKARMEALGLHKMASSLKGSAARRPSQVGKSARRKGKRQVVDEKDEDYKPEDEVGGEHADELDEDVDDVEDDGDEDLVGHRSTSKSRRSKAKNKKGSTHKKGAGGQKSFKGANCVDEDLELMQAIALSLQDSAKELAAAAAEVQETAGRRKNKKSFNSRVKMTEDDLILHFFQFDERGSGTITRRDLDRVATAHDFTWTGKELADMINCFDGDGDGKLNLDDFRKIVSRCNMFQGSEDP